MARGAGLGGVRAASATATSTGPAYYRPVLFHRRAFPLLRSDDLSLIQIFRNWHAPRLRLVGGTWKLVGVHEGIDIAAERDTPIVALAAGSVENLGWTFYSGNRVGIRGMDGRYYLYAHLTTAAPGLRPGSPVSAGQPIGTVGNTGYGPPGHADEFPPHLHLGMEGAAGWINPYPVLASLYGATVRAQERLERRLAGLPRGGSAWRRVRARLYAQRQPWA